MNRMNHPQELEENHHPKLKWNSCCNGVWKDMCLLSMFYSILFYESPPVGLAEVIDASEASLGGPGGRPSQMYKNRVK